MPFSLVDSFNRSLGVSVASLEEAEDKIEEMGEAAGEITIIETVKEMDDGVDMSSDDIVKTGKKWIYDFVLEKFIEQQS